MVEAAPLDDRGKISDHSQMETRMRQTYANAKKILSECGATLDNVVTVAQRLIHDVLPLGSSRL
jgi:enamine deaminase RidA (YjgF/YER057c/UK114 family)